MTEQVLVSGRSSSSSARTQRRRSTAPRAVAGSWKRVRRPVRVDVQPELDRSAEASHGAREGGVGFASTCPRCLDTIYSRFSASWRCPDCSRS